MMSSTDWLSLGYYAKGLAFPSSLFFFTKSVGSFSNYLAANLLFMPLSKHARCFIVILSMEFLGSSFWQNFFAAIALLIKVPFSSFSSR